MKLSISLDDNLVKRIDSFASGNSISRSGFLAMAATQYINQMQALSSMPDFVQLMKTAAANGMTSSKDDTEKLEEVEGQSSYIVSESSLPSCAGCRHVCIGVDGRPTTNPCSKYEPKK